MRAGMPVRAARPARLLRLTRRQLSGYVAPMSTGLQILVILLLILVNGLFAMGEMALISVRQARLAVLEAQGVAGAALARRMAEEPQMFLPTVQVGITLVGIIAGVFGGAHLAAVLGPLIGRISWLRPVAGDVSLAVVVVLITYATMVLGELVPKQLALRHPETIAALLARPIDILSRITAPVIWLLSGTSDLLLRAMGAHRPLPGGVTEEELKAVLAEGAQTGVLELEEHDMIARVMRLAGKPVRAIMTPRTELAWINRDDPPERIAAALHHASGSWLVVCEGSADNPVGVLWAKDLLGQTLAGEKLSLATVLRPATIVPDRISALDALDRLRADPMRLAFVLDEYGSFEGVVSAVDVLQAIVGDPADTTPLAADGAPLVDGALEAEGLMPVDELITRLGLPPLPDAGSYHTLGGLLLALLRRVPRVGDRIIFGGWRFEVLEMDGRRVARVQIRNEAALEN